MPIRLRQPHRLGDPPGQNAGRGNIGQAYLLDAIARARRVADECSSAGRGDIWRQLYDLCNELEALAYRQGASAEQLAQWRLILVAATEEAARRCTPAQQAPVVQANHPAMTHRRDGVARHSGMGGFMGNAVAAMDASPNYFAVWYTLKSIALVGVSVALAYNLGKDAGRRTT